jgi:hypothetical protein
MRDMTNMNPTRKNEAGQPTTNGGHFAAKTHDDATDVVLAGPRPRRQVLYADLEPGDVLIGDSGGGRLTVNDVQPSSARPGTMAVETDFGFLYVDAEETVTVAAEDETYLQFDPSTVTEPEFTKTWFAAKSKLGVQGTYFTREDADGILSSDEEADDIDGNEFWDALQDRFEWSHLDDILSEAGNEALRAAANEVIESLRAK